MVQLTGEECFSKLPADVWSCLVDTDFLANCLPGLESAAVDEAGKLVCRVRPGLSFFKGTLKVTLDLQDPQPPESVRIRVSSKGIGASAIVDTSVKLSPDEGGTRLIWSSEVIELGGLLKPIGRSLISAAATRLIAEGWSRFRERLA